MKKVIIDTDIGTDVDDVLALVYALKSSELDVKAITTVHGDTKLRGKIAKKLCQLIRPETYIPVAAGYEKPLNLDKIFWAGFEGRDLDLENVHLEEEDIDNFLSKNIYDNKGITLISLVPYTNIANLLQRFPETKEYIERIYLMNRGSQQGKIFVLDETAHNTKADPDAAKIVFQSGIPITLVTTELSKRTYLTDKDFEKIKEMEKPWSNIIYQNSIDWLNFSCYDVSYLYDPLTVAVAENPSIVQLKSIGNLEIAVGLNVDFKEQFLKRMKLR